MRVARRRGAAFVSAALALTVARASHAAPCRRPDVDATFPPQGATAVPANAILAAHYRAPADYDDEAVTLTRDEVPVPVDVAYDNAESMLRAVPQMPLGAGTYRVVWPALRGVATSVGLGATRSFEVGAGVDAAAPRFDGLDAAAWDFEREDDPCTDSLEDRFTYALSLGPFSDDQATSLLSVVVFETKSPGRPTGSEPIQLAVLPLPSGGTVRIERPSKQAGDVCFAAVLRDLALNVSGGGDQEACVETVEPPFFEGCTLAGPSRSASGSVALFAAGLAGLALLRRRRRSLGVLGVVASSGMLGCGRPASSESPPGAEPLARAGRFECRAGACSQRHVRLPDDGEWRCAELDGTVLCAGGEPAAGTVAGAVDRAFRCGHRPNGERVCVDAAPDYPPGGRERYACRFDAEHGVSRECREHPTKVPAVALASLPSGSPTCWLDRDCAGRCERGYCSGAPR